MNKALFYCSVFILFSLIGVIGVFATSIDNITCSSDNDCISGYTGSEYCIGNYVYKNYNNSTCINGGNNQSYCSDNINPVRLDPNCGESNFEAFGDHYCNGSDIYHSRAVTLRGCRLINPITNISGCFSDFSFENVLVQSCSNGCLNGACIGGNITCTLNRDCGQNRFLNQLSCQGSNLMDFYLSYWCINAGTSLSYCSNSSDNTIINICSYGCQNNSCNNPPVVCTQDSNCGNLSERLKCEGKNITKEISTPRCIDNSCINQITIENLHKCSEECKNGKCVTHNHHEGDDFPGYDIMNNSAGYSFDQGPNYGLLNLNESVQKLKPSEVLILDNKKSIFENNWFIVLLVLIVVIIIIIIILSLMR